MNEHRALVSMIDRSTVSEKVIALMDRGYESFNNIAHFQEKSWYFFIRAKESYGIISNLALPDTDESDTDLDSPADKGNLIVIKSLSREISLDPASYYF